MAFILSKVLWFFLAPGNALLSGLALGGLARWLGLRRLGGGVIGVCAVTLLLVVVFPVGNRMMRVIEDRFPEPAVPARVDGIVVLGGTVKPMLTAMHDQVALDGSAERLTRAIALKRRHPEARLVFTGGNGRLDARGGSEAGDVRRFWREQGLDVSGVVFEGRSRNTFENALYTRDIVKPKPGEVWLLVTSAVHLPRSVGCFRVVGWDVLPYPVDYQTGAPGSSGILLASERLSGLDAAVREVIGMIAYRLMNRTDAFFPAPGRPAGPGADGPAAAPPATPA